MKLKLILISLLLSGCATTPPSKEEVRNIFSAVQRSNFRHAQELYNQTPNGTHFEVYGSTSKISAKEMDRLFSVATDYMSMCEDLVQKMKRYNQSNPIGTPALPADIVGEFKEKCELNSNEKLKSDFAKIKQYSTVDFKPDTDSINKLFLAETSVIEGKLAGKRKAELEMEQNAKQQEEYENSPAFYSKKLCEMTDIIKAAKGIISKEQEIGKVSGVVDKQRLYEAGQAITANERHIKHFSAEYKSKFGKLWKLSECK